jgi:hypothetical protein
MKAKATHSFRDSLWFAQAAAQRTRPPTQALQQRRP